jgi:hypothetical protein
MLIKFKHVNVTGAPRAAEERQERAPLRCCSMNKIFPGCRLFPLNFDICSKGQVRFERLRRLLVR